MIQKSAVVFSAASVAGLGVLLSSHLWQQEQTAAVKPPQGLAAAVDATTVTGPGRSGLAVNDVFVELPLAPASQVQVQQHDGDELGDESVILASLPAEMHVLPSVVPDTSGIEQGQQGLLNANDRAGGSADDLASVAKRPLRKRSVAMVPEERRRIQREGPAGGDTRRLRDGHGIEASPRAGSFLRGSRREKLAQAREREAAALGVGSQRQEPADRPAPNLEVQLDASQLPNQSASDTQPSPQLEASRWFKKLNIRSDG